MCASPMMWTTASVAASKTINTASGSTVDASQGGTTPSTSADPRSAAPMTIHSTPRSATDAPPNGAILLNIWDPRVHLISRMKRLYRADPEVRPSGHVDHSWNGYISHSVNQDMDAARKRIRDKSSGKPTKETQFMPDLLMTGIAQMGAKRVLLTPCVWFFCGSLWCKRIVKSAARDLKWLDLYGIHECRFQVGGAVLAAYEDEAKELRHWGPQLKHEHGIQLFDDQYKGYLHIEDSKESAIGLSCCSTVTQNDTIISQKLAIVAGVVDVETLSHTIRLGFTTGHNLAEACIDKLQEDIFEKDRGTIPTQEHCVDVYDGADGDSDAESGVDSDEYSDNCSFTDENATSVPNRDIEIQATKWLDVSQNASGTFAGFDFGYYPNSRPPSPARSQLLSETDLAVFELPVAHGDYNTYRNPYGVLINITSHITYDELGSDEVFIINALEVVTEAYPLPGPMYFNIRGRPLRTVRLKCKYPLDIGSSGSCVVRGGAMCGMLMAVFPGTQYALMIPWEQIVCGIRSIIPNVSAVQHASRPLHSDPVISDDNFQRAPVNDTAPSTVGFRYPYWNQDFASTSGRDTPAVQQEDSEVSDFDWAPPDPLLEDSDISDS
ncbi:hypothetical protein VPNG_01008 [Cytospora leucostoma]|uniref:Uncharacterized protein n=1 Tax=Cytospora leucostoma TaxID=1230097 RepID=A0A423XLA4_9PEZI|nr:hypothetical protein VPNG_01008 [Cytospora leucostoma]